MPKKVTVMNTEANKAPAKYATLKIEEHEYKMAWDFDQICAVEKETGVNMASAIFNFANMSTTQLRAFMLAFIRGGDPKSSVTLSEAGALVRVDTLGDIISSFAQVIELSIPEKPGTKSAA